MHRLCFNHQKAELMNQFSFASHGWSHSSNGGGKEGGGATSAAL